MERDDKRYTSNGGMAMSESVAVSNTSNMWGQR